MYALLTCVHLFIMFLGLSYFICIMLTFDLLSYCFISLFYKLSFKSHSCSLISQLYIHFLHFVLNQKIEHHRLRALLASPIFLTKAFLTVFFRFSGIYLRFLQIDTRFLEFPLPYRVQSTSLSNVILDKVHGQCAENVIGSFIFFFFVIVLSIYQLSFILEFTQYRLLSSSAEWCQYQWESQAL